MSNITAGEKLKSGQKKLLQKIGTLLQVNIILNFHWYFTEENKLGHCTCQMGSSKHILKHKGGTNTRMWHSFCKEREIIRTEGQIFNLRDPPIFIQSGKQVGCWKWPSILDQWSVSSEVHLYLEVEIKALFHKSRSNCLEVGTSEHCPKSAKPFTSRTNRTAEEGSAACRATWKEMENIVRSRKGHFADFS